MRHEQGAYLSPRSAGAKGGAGQATGQALSAPAPTEARADAQLELKAAT